MPPNYTSPINNSSRSWWFTLYTEDKWHSQQIVFSLSTFSVRSVHGAEHRPLIFRIRINKIFLSIRLVTWHGILFGDFMEESYKCETSTVLLVKYDINALRQSEHRRMKCRSKCSNVNNLSGGRTSVKGKIVWISSLYMGKWGAWWEKDISLHQ